ncbi:MAG: hypothetical protein HQM12_02675 [SAR324 cluster bacterium]|nr:hypothetical protein [SAR324 cluster bacterium]
MSQIQSTLKQNNFSHAYEKNYLNIIFNASDLETIPDLGQRYHNELGQRVHEIRAFYKSKSLVTQTLTSKLFSSKKDTPDGIHGRISGLELITANPSADQKSRTSVLQTDPAQHPQRIALVRSCLNHPEHLSLDQVRAIMMHASIPFSMDHYNPEWITCIHGAFLLYQDRLLTFYQNQVSKLELRLLDEARKETSNQENLQRAIDQIMRNIHLLKNLIPQCPPRMSIPDFLKPCDSNHFRRILDGKVDKLEEVREKMIRNLLFTGTLMLPFRYIHPQIQQIAEWIQKLDPTHPGFELLQARIWEEKLKPLVVLDNLGFSCKPQLDKILKKSLTAYGKSLRILSAETNPSSYLRQSILGGYAQMCLKAYDLRHILAIPPDAMRQMLVAGKKALDKSGITLDESPENLYRRFMEVLDSENLPLNIVL